MCCDGIYQDYTIWTQHSEVDKKTKSDVTRHEIDEDMHDRLEDLIYDIGESSFTKTCIYDTLCSDKDVLLYKGCTSFTRFSTVLKKFNVKEKKWLDG